MIVIVGGQARKVGKTRTACQIIEATRDLNWTAAKVTPHLHETASSDHLTDTERYLAAGAADALLVTSFSELPPAGNLLIESNAAVGPLTPDLLVFVTDSANPEWKSSASRVVSRADLVINRELSPQDLENVVARIRRLSVTV